MFDQDRVADGVAIHGGGEIAWAMRPGSPKLLEMVNAFVTANPKGSTVYNVLVKKYLGNTKFVKNADPTKTWRASAAPSTTSSASGGRYDFPWLLLRGTGVPGVGHRSEPRQLGRRSRHHADQAVDG